MRWFLYNILFAVGYLLVLPRFLWRMRKRGGYGKGFMERFGRYAPEVEARLREKPRLWIHAVSVGEVLIALRFMEEMRRVDPAMAHVLTTTTPTARAIAQSRMDAEDVLLYFPVDFPCVMRRVLDRLRPCALTLTENELWPNLVRIAQERDIPVFLVNGRLSQSSAAGYRRLRWFFGPILRALTLSLVQGNLDRNRLVAAGADPERVQVVNSAKYDIAQANAAGLDRAQAVLRAAGMDGNATLLLGGSTWPGEERMLCEVYRELQARHPPLRLVLVPRHAERRAAVVRDVAQAGLNPALRSQLGDTDSALTAPDGFSGSERDVLVVDSTGDLMDFYACADLVFVGKSMPPHCGGQNVIEPARLGKPVVVGPHMENFPGILADFLTQQALVQVSGREGLEETLDRWLASPEQSVEMGQRARAVAEAKRGGIATSVERIREHLGRRDG